MERKILYVNSNDFMGEKFSGIDWFEELKKFNWTPSMLVGHKVTKNYPEIQQFTKLNSPNLISLIRALEIKKGKLNYYSPLGQLFFRNPKYKEADLVHFQVMHDLGWFRLENIYKTARTKPSIWTWHDSWNFTGHCLQPINCYNFENNCETCPHLDWVLPIAKDTAKLEKIRKIRLAEKETPTIHITTEWTRKLIEKSKGFDHLDIEVIPFGIDLSKNFPGNKTLARASLGINQEDFVIGFRSSSWNVKNIALIRESLKNLSAQDRQIVVCSVDEIGLLDKEINKMNGIRLIELGWLKETDLTQFYSSLDVFFGLSTAESFGFMALEAYAKGIPVICLKESAIAEMVKKILPEHCVNNSARDVVEVLQQLISESVETKSRNQGRILDLVANEYSLPIFVEKITNLYHRKIEYWRSK